MTLRDVARAWYLQPQNLPPDVDTGGLEVTAGYRAERDSGTFSYATHAVVVAVDPETGHVEILDYVVVEDGGTLVNPMIVDGQICGGTVQGIGTVPLRGDAVRRAGPAAGLDADGLPAAERDRGAPHPRPAHGDALAVHRVRHRRASAKAARSGRRRRSSPPSTMRCGRSARRCTICR